MKQPRALVIGASGGIGSAVARQLSAHYRQPGDIWALTSREGLSIPTINTFACQHDPSAIRQWVEIHGPQLNQLERIVIATGKLHDASIIPEKRLEQLDAVAMMSLYQANAMVPLCWLAALAPYLNGRGVIAVLSARVGSIGDNHLGGWYSYRMAKAALNQGLTCAAIELARRLPHFKVMAYHPGTVDTPLSEPFQQRLAPGQLLQPIDTATRLVELMNTTEADGQLSYLDWRGQTIPW